MVPLLSFSFLSPIQIVHMFFEVGELFVGMFQWVLASHLRLLVRINEATSTYGSYSETSDIFFVKYLGFRTLIYVEAYDGFVKIGIWLVISTLQKLQELPTQELKTLEGF